MTNEHLIYIMVNIEDLLSSPAFQEAVKKDLMLGKCASSISERARAMWLENFNVSGKVN